MTDIRTYPAILKRVDGDYYLVSFPDLPEARTFGTSRENAQTQAVDCLREAMRRRIADKEPIPKPSPVETGMDGIRLAPGIAVAVATYEARCRDGISLEPVDPHPVRFVDRPSQLCDLDRKPPAGYVAWSVGHAWPKGSADPMRSSLTFHAPDEASALRAARARSPSTTSPTANDPRISTGCTGASS